MLSDERPQPREAEHLSLGVTCLYKTVAVEQCSLASIERYLLLLESMLGMSPKGIPLTLSSSASPLLCR